MSYKFGVVIAAGGVGSRFGGDIPKQYVDVNSMPVIAHTISKFQNIDIISEIVIVSHKNYIVYCNDIVKEFDFSKVTSIIEGGNTRQQSVYKGLKSISSDYVLIHDAARPLVSERDIEKCCNVLKDTEACALGARIVDTVKKSIDGEYISETIDRSTLWTVQTPQCFKKSTIIKCHQNALFDSFEATDDCMLAERYGVKIRLVESSTTNLKITDYKDLAIAEVLLNV